MLRKLVDTRNMQIGVFVFLLNIAIGTLKKEALADPTWLFVLPWSLDGNHGVNQVVLNLMSEFKAGKEIKSSTLIADWASCSPVYRLVNGMPSASMRLHPVLNAKSPWLSLISFLGQLPRSLIYLRAIFRFWNVRVINCHYVGLSALVFVLMRQLRLTRARLILSVHGMDVATATSANGIHRIAWHILLSKADAIVACSKDLSMRVIEFSPRSASRVHVIHNGIDRERFLSGSPSPFHLPSELKPKSYILSVAAFERKKGHDVLLGAFSQIANKRPDIQLVLVGGTGPQSPEIDAMIWKLGMSHRVHVYENVPHYAIAVFMRSALLFVLASRSEPFGIVLLEAGISCLPVVATNVGGIPEIISDGIHGALVPAEDQNALAKAIVAIVDNPGRARLFAKNLADRVNDNFSWSSSASKYLTVAKR